jgi:phage repressor protein C with HTH and peptisase S24 domain
MEVMDPRRKLLELAEARGVSLSRLSRMIGKNPSYLQQFIRKGSPRRLEEVDRGRLSRFLGVNEYELGKEKENSSGSADWIDIPRLAVGASAGPGSLLAEDEVFGAIRFSPRWLRSMGLVPEMLSIIAVSGDSMEPALRDGDEILVDRSLRALREGIHVVRLEGTLLVKRIEMGVGGRLTLLSDNPVYRPITCSLEDVEVIGRVVWKGGRL